MAGLFDSLMGDLGTDDPRKAAYLALASGLLAGKGNFGQVAGQAVMGSQEAFQNARKMQQASEVQRLQMEKLQREAEAAKRAQAATEWFKSQLQSPYDASVGDALQGGGGPTLGNAAKQKPIDPNQSLLYKAMQAGMVDPLHYVQSLQKDDTPVIVPEGGRLLSGRASGYKELGAGNPKLTNDQREYADAVKQGFKGSILDYQLALKSAGANRVVTNVNAYTPASEEAQKEFMKSTRATYDTLKTAPVVLQNIEAAKKLVPSAASFMGPGGEGLLVAAKFMNSRLGMDINVEGVKGAEELRTRLFTQIMENLKKMDAQPSQLQQQMMMQSLGNLGTDPQALPRVLDVIGQAVKTKVSLHNKEVSDATKRGVKFPYDPTVSLSGTSVFDAADEILRKP